MRMRLRIVRPTALCLVAIALFMVSCSSAPSSPAAPGTSATPDKAAAVKPYGSLTVAVNPQSGGGWDPLDRGTANTFQVAPAAVFDSLVELSPEGQARPGIAERWEISRDGLTHTFYIRKGVKFHDGSDLTGADVKFSVERMLSPQSSHVDAATWRGLIDGVDLKDDYTVALRLKRPQFELITGFQELSGSPAVLPKKYIEEKGVDYFRKNPVGSGPWKVVNYVPGSRIDLEAVESHWRAVPQFKNVTLLTVPEVSTKVAMLKTGELDIAEVVPDSAAGLKSAGLRMLEHQGASQAWAPMFYDLDNPQKYALGDLKVRQALSLAINRQEMADKLLAGYAKPSALFYAMPSAYFFDANLLKPDPYDPEGAKRLLAEAGRAGGFKLTVWDSGGGGLGSTLAQAIAGYLFKVGVNAQVTPIEGAKVYAMYFPKHLPEIWDSLWLSTTGGGVFNFEKMYIIYHSQRGTLKNLRNSKLDELIDKVPMTADLAEKKKVALEAAVLAKKEYSHLPILDFTTIYALGPKVGGMVPVKGMTLLPPALETATHAK